MMEAHGGDIWKAAIEAGVDPADIIDFSASIVPFGLSPLVRERIVDSLELAHAYPDPGNLALKSALSSFFCLPEPSLLPTAGSTELIYLLPRLFKARRAIIVEPAFSEYRAALELVGARVEDFLCKEEDGFLPDLPRLIERIRKGADICLIANPANPTGALLKKDALSELARECAASGTVLVVDEAFMDFAEEESIKDEAALRDNLIVLRSMTKFFSLAGLRLGFMVASLRIVERAKGELPPWSVGTLAQAAGVAALADTAHMERVREWFSSERGPFFSGLSEVNGITPLKSAANFFALKIDGALKGGELRDMLFKEGFLIRDLSSFRGMDERFVRVSLREREDNLRLVSLLKGALMRAREAV